MQVLSKGYKKPQDPDTGDIFFPALEENWQRVNDHNHNGSNSEQLYVQVQPILNSAWVAAPQGGGIFRQLVTMPAGYLYDSTTMEFRLSSGQTVYPTVERVSTTTYYVYTNDNSLSYIAMYR